MTTTPSESPAEKVASVVDAILSDLGANTSELEAKLFSNDCPNVFDSLAMFGGFVGRFSLQQGCMPYSVEAVGHLTVREFCALYVQESYPEPPSDQMAETAYAGGEFPHGHRSEFPAIDIPICFVLGCGRSGTTLFRVMLNMHDALWAPGELLLAQFDTMAARAERIGPYLQHTLVAEVADRLGETAEAFSQRLATWEGDAKPVTDVFQELHDADPGRMIVDKSPPYSRSPRDLSWIKHHFPNARFVHLIRSPYDVIRSLVRIQLYKSQLAEFGPGTSPYHIAETVWYRNNANITAFLDDLPAERHLVVRYEDIVADTRTALHSVCDLLDIAYDGAMANPYERAGGPVATGAGDPLVNLLNEVEARVPSDPFYPLGERTMELASSYGY